MKIFLQREISRLYLTSQEKWSDDVMQAQIFNNSREVFAKCRELCLGDGQATYSFEDKP